jgi:hypothetical protein
MTTDDPRGEPTEPHFPAKMGRPSKEYDEVLASKLCAYVASGMTLDEVAEQPEFPSAPTLYRWLASNEEFARSFAAALSWRTERRIDELLETSRDGSRDFAPSATGADDEEILVEQKETLGRSTLHSKNLKWVIKREMPRKYNLTDVVPLLPPPSEQPNPYAPNASGLMLNDPLASNYDAWNKAAGDAKTVIPK